MNEEIKLRYVYRNKLSNCIVIIEYSLEQIEQGISNSRHNQNPNEYELITKDLCSPFVDRTGVPIYEGDIVIDYPNKSLGWTSAIEYTEGQFSFSKEHHRSLFELYTRRRLVIIGNVHKNPELLG